MTDQARCAYCADLPERPRKSAARLARCPLCKTPRGVTPAGEAFRLGGEGPPAPRRGLLLAGVGSLAGALLAAAAVARMAGSGENLSPPAPAVVVSDLASTESVAAAPAVSAEREKSAWDELLARAAELPRATGRGPGGIALHAGLRVKGKDVPTPAPPPVARDRRPAAPPVRVDLGVVPEVALEDRAPGKLTKDEAKRRTAELAERVRKANGKKPDAFVRGLPQSRPELAGMPFLLGKDCQAPADAARALATGSQLVRSLLNELPRTSRSGASPTLPRGNGSAFFTAFFHHAEYGRGKVAGDEARVEMFPALTQVLAAEAPELRAALVPQVQDVPGAAVTRALVKLALYDPDSQVRWTALGALHRRPHGETAGLLFDALGYPWPAVAERAADALVELNRTDLVPALVDALARPDPCAPREAEQDGRRVRVVRELVRVNHHRNCLLCHAPADPADGRDGSLRGLLARVPSPSEPLPPSSSTVYYDERRGETVVRADVTYLRQDFSALLPVADAEPWPVMQRFDFFVRTRVMPDDASAPAGPSPHHLAVHSALRRLTGVELAPDAAAWRAWFADRAARQEGRWRVDCRK